MRLHKQHELLAELGDDRPVRRRALFTFMIFLRMRARRVRIPEYAAPAPFDACSYTDSPVHSPQSLLYGFME